MIYRKFVLFSYNIPIFLAHLCYSMHYAHPFNSTECAILILLKKSLTISLLLSGILVTQASLAWRHGIAAGYGYGHEIDAPYYNSGFFLHGIVYKFNKLDKFLTFSITASLGIWRAHYASNRHLTTLSTSAMFRTYFFNPPQRRFRPYLQASFGPTYLSNKTFGTEKQGSHFAFQTTLGGGIEIGSLQHAVDLTLQFIHYCNAGLSSPNDGSDIPYVFTIGYLF
jgi:hypothetical protein